MSLQNLLTPLREENFIALILDNEVTVGEFVKEPPLPWRRIIFADGRFRIADGYPALLTDKQAEFEMTNWDDVNLAAICSELNDIAGGVDRIVFGNNAGQGVPLAGAVAPAIAADQGIVIYAQSLPEQSAYERLGYRTLCRRSELIDQLPPAVRATGRALSLCFLNTIQHNNANYHRPF